MFSGRKPGIKRLKVFCSVCYTYILNNLRHKLEETSAKDIFIGYGAREKGYTVFNPATQKVTISRDVIFYENGKWDWEKLKVKEICVPLISTDFMELSETEGTAMPGQQSQPFATTPLSSSTLSESSSSQSRVTSSQTGLLDSQTYDSTPLRWRNLNEIYEHCSLCIVEHENFEDVGQYDSLRKAMEEEMDMIEKNNTWEWVNRRMDKPIVQVKWV